MTQTRSGRPAPTDILFLAGALLAASYLADTWVKLAQPWGPAWKCGGIVLLGAYALSRNARLAGLGLLLSALGDVLLELDGLFVGGMAAFGLAHLCYSAVFLGLISREGLMRARWPLALCIAAAALVLGIWFAPGQAREGLGLPALAYQAIITLMVLSAVMSKAGPLAKLGALAFMASDTLIAIGMFAQLPVPPGSVWITYAGAQIMLASGLTRVRGKAGANEAG